MSATTGVQVAFLRTQGIPRPKRCSEHGFFPKKTGLSFRNKQFVQMLVSCMHASIKNLVKHLYVWVFIFYFYFFCISLSSKAGHGFTRCKTKSLGGFNRLKTSRIVSNTNSHLGKPANEDSWLYPILLLFCYVLQETWGYILTASF